MDLNPPFPHFFPFCHICCNLFFSATILQSCSLLCVVVFVQLLSHVQLFVTPWTAALQASLCFTVSQSLLSFMSTESMMLANHFILCLPLLLLPSVFPSIRIFSDELTLCIRWPKYWSFCFSVNPSKLIFRIDFL